MKRIATVVSISFVVPLSTAQSVTELETHVGFYTHCVDVNVEKALAGQPRTGEYLLKAFDISFEKCKPLAVDLRINFGDAAALEAYFRARDKTSYRVQYGGM